MLPIAAEQAYMLCHGAAVHLLLQIHSPSSSTQESLVSMLLPFACDFLRHHVKDDIAALNMINDSACNFTCTWS